jgi:hypothetical protein
MGQLVFQATAGGQVALVGPNPSSNFSLNVPAVNGNLVTTGDTGTVTNTMLASSAYTAPGTIGLGTPNTGAFTTLTSTSNIINGATSGAITLAVPAVSGSNTATFPATTGTVMVSGNMPAFSAYGSTNQNPTSGVATKVIFNNKLYDTNNCFDNVTNYRFTPTVAGYYQVNAVIEAASTSITNYTLSIYKNGSEVLRGASFIYCNCVEIYPTVSGLFYMNGSTDYLEIYITVVSATTITLYGGNAYKTFSGALVRTA